METQRIWKVNWSKEKMNGQRFILLITLFLLYLEFFILTFEFFLDN